MADIKSYKPESSSIGSGQVLQRPYDHAGGRLIVQEMTDLLVLDLVDKGLVTDQMVLTVGYDIENLSDPDRRKSYGGPVVTDHFGRQKPKHAHGSVNLDRQTSSTRRIMEAVLGLYDRIVDPALLVRRVNLVANHVVPETEARLVVAEFEQMSLFVDYAAEEERRQREEAERARERKMQQAVLDIKKKHGKGAILKGMNLQEGAMTRERNNQIGGHKA